MCVQIIWIRRYRVLVGEGVPQLLNSTLEILWRAVLIIERRCRERRLSVPSASTYDPNQSCSGAPSEPSNSEQEVPRRE